jgi:predicted metalloprotease with PDZ domain
MDNLKKVVYAATQIIGDIPYNQYTFIGIGPGQGGIEHLNNTTVSFNGTRLNSSEGALNTMMSFLAHEYFHHYNVKRIRPFELGPFDYDKENKTNLLWVSEGLSVYYEYLIIKRGGIITEQMLYKNFESSINAFENNPGRSYQSLTQASYETWSDGPFGKQGEDANKSISYYDKGPAVGLILDLAIRNATKNVKSLDDVMRLLYWQYYKKLQRGFTDAEFQQACESVAGISLNHEFEYVYTTKELDYNTYLAYAGLKAVIITDAASGKRKFSIQPLEKTDAMQNSILQSWLGNK